MYLMPLDCTFKNGKFHVVYFRLKKKKSRTLLCPTKAPHNWLPATSLSLSYHLPSSPHSSHTGLLLPPTCPRAYAGAAPSPWVILSPGRCTTPSLISFSLWSNGSSSRRTSLTTSKMGSSHPLTPSLPCFITTRYVYFRVLSVALTRCKLT